MKAIHHLHGVLEVHVVVTGAMDFEQIAFQIGREIHRGAPGVGIRIVFGQAHIALGVNRVVQAPIRNRGNRDPGLEHIGVGHGIEGEVAAIAPSPKAQTIAIDLGELL